MAKLIKIHSSIQEHEARLVNGMQNNNRKVQNELYNYCSDYFWNNYKGVFFAEEEAATEIFQNSFIAFWENIERKKIYEEDGVIKGNNNKPINGSIRTYFMGIAKLKYLEWVRENPFNSDPDDEERKKIKKEGINPHSNLEMIYGSGDSVIIEIIADVLSRMSPRCNEILTKFYYEEKDLDSILHEMPSIESKNALKTKKYKCIENMRKTVSEIYQQYLNS